MIKIVCDRCGKEIEEGRDNEFHFTGTRNTRYGYDKTVNLCNNCLNEFYKFMEKKK